MLTRTVEYLHQYTLKSAKDYWDAETELSRRFAENTDQFHWSPAGAEALRRAGQVAIEIDALADRARLDLNKEKTKRQILDALGPLCVWPDSGHIRVGCMERIRGVANAHKHGDLDDTHLPITGEDDVLAIGLGYGLDVFSAGKFGSPEVLVREKTGKQLKFLADVPLAIHGWLRFLKLAGVVLPESEYVICGLRLRP